MYDLITKMKNKNKKGVAVAAYNTQGLSMTDPR
jgi:hypothetical protein